MPEVSAADIVFLLASALVYGTVLYLGDKSHRQRMTSYRDRWVNSASDWIALDEYKQAQRCLKHASWLVARYKKPFRWMFSSRDCPCHGKSNAARSD